MSLLTRSLGETLRAELSQRETSNGFGLEDVIRSGVRHPDSSIGIYAPDAQSYGVFRELFEPVLEALQAPVLAGMSGLACVDPAAVVSTRIRVGRNLAGHVFPAGMARAQRLQVQDKLAHACGFLAPHFPGTLVHLADLAQDRLDDMVSQRLAFGPHDKYMAAAGIHADWPQGRSVFNGQDPRLSVWINEEDHLRVAVVMPGACVRACHEVLGRVMSLLGAQLDFCEDARHGYLTSCPSNAGTALRASFRVDLRLNAAQDALLERLESAGLVQIRGVAGEHAPRTGGLADVGFRNRVGTSGEQMLEDMERLLTTRGV